MILIDVNAVPPVADPVGRVHDIVFVLADVADAETPVGLFGLVVTVTADEDTYEIRDYIANSDWTTVASMIKRSNFNRLFCVQAASIIRLSDYGKSKSRSWMRQTGIFEMRDKNEIGALDENDLERARFAYYAETLKFLPNTPEGIKRTIAEVADNF